MLIKITNMLSDPIRTNNHLQVILSVLSRYELNSDNLEIVPSTYGWASQRRIRSVTRDILAFSTTETNDDNKKQRKIIILLEKMFLNDVKSVLSRIDYPNTKPTASITSDERFIEHLVLHEIGHLIKEIKQSEEEEADNFAFREMGLM